VFIYAGAVKLSDPGAFAEVVDAYGLTPDFMIPFVALGLPALEVLAGIGLLFEVRGSLAAIAGMTILFLAVLAYGIAIGLDVDCGCYGPGDPEADAFQNLRTAFNRDLLLLAGIAFLYIRRRMVSPVFTRPLRRFRENRNGNKSRSFIV
jgi:uncharacterized membrane protein YphA (DoxX/SURF4 family)